MNSTQMALLVAQLSWCYIGMAVGLYFGVNGRVDTSLVFFSASVAYAALSIAAYRGNRWYRWIAALPPAFAFLNWGPWAIYNLYLYLADDPLYLDSPAAIIVVGANALVLLMPALVVLAFMLAAVRRRALPSRT